MREGPLDVKMTVYGIKGRKVGGPEQEVSDLQAFHRVHPEKM
jgi:hypothetical protein